ncbi:serpin family protein [Streptomyces sp. NPDC016845]|uniref:serpin family protein n=1 Tax=Streptomyces sp. NPDC016845 TaxID=3364972 RepID=UPI0037AE4D0B
MAIATTVRAVNDLTARWADVSEGGTVFSAAGVWPLLAHLADGADGAARAELAEAIGLSAGQAAGASRELLATMGTVQGLDAALGLWTKRTLKLREEWETALPAHAHGLLTGDDESDHRTLDAWTAERTGGLIDRMPVDLETRTRLVLASALALRTEWQLPFRHEELTTAYGPWAGKPLLGLRRSGGATDEVAVADTSAGRVTEVKVLGNNDLDVHLLLGEEGMKPGRVLGAGLDILAGRCAAVPGPKLPHGNAGPGLRVEDVRCTRPEPPSLEVATAAFDMNESHDLRDRRQLFGLTTAMDTTVGHFSGISDFPPLAVGSARQNILARFRALGFEAAAVTAINVVATSLPDLRYMTTRVSATFDRPFGFLALHRRTGLVLTAGWVTEPLPFTGYGRHDER